MKYDPQCEEAWSAGFREGLETVEAGKGWTVIGLVGAALSGAVVGLVVGLLVGRLL